jgi:hypothetical protein
MMVKNWLAAQIVGHFVIEPEPAVAIRVLSNYFYCWWEFFSFKERPIPEEKDESESR